jgi:hypothetical protein
VALATLMPLDEAAYEELAEFYRNEVAAHIRGPY